MSSYVKKQENKGIYNGQNDVCECGHARKYHEQYSGYCHNCDCDQFDDKPKRAPSGDSRIYGNAATTGICLLCGQPTRTHQQCPVCHICIGKNHIETELIRDPDTGKLMCFWCSLNLNKTRKLVRSA